MMNNAIAALFVILPLGLIQAFPPAEKPSQESEVFKNVPPKECLRMGGKVEYNGEIYQGVRGCKIQREAP